MVLIQNLENIIVQLNITVFIVTTYYLDVNPTKLVNNKNRN